MQKRGIFITGTDTNIGKTLTSALLASALKQLKIKSPNQDFGYFKPIQTGTDLDTETVRTLAHLNDHEVQNPVYAFPEPISPNQAADLNGSQIHLDSIGDTWNDLDHRSWIIEGAGGLLVPLNSRETIRDLIAFLKLPCLIVASTRLGTLNHTLLTLEAARAKNIFVKGLVLVGEKKPELEETLAHFTRVKVLARIPTFETVNPVTIQKYALELFPEATLNQIFNSNESLSWTI